MKTLQSLILGLAASAFLGTFACQKTASTESETATTGKKLVVDEKIPPVDTMVFVESIQPKKYYCVAQRIDENQGRVYFGDADTESGACDSARNICNSITGGGGGTGQCITSVAFDNLITGGGMLSEDSREEYLCFATLYPITVAGIAPKWVGKGKTITQAYDNAIKLCQFRGGGNCQKFAACLDTSNFNIRAGQ